MPDKWIRCFNCDAVIAVVDKDGDHNSTIEGKKLHVIGGFPVYACLRCGAVQSAERDATGGNGFE